MLLIGVFWLPRAHVTTPSASTPVLDMILLDNGVGADAIRDDGIYTKYFTQFAGKVTEGKQHCNAFNRASALGYCLRLI